MGPIVAECIQAAVRRANGSKEEEFGLQTKATSNLTP